MLPRILRAVLFPLLVSVMPATGLAADAADDPRAEDRKQLLAVFAEVVNAINEQNIDRMVAQMDHDATVVWLNAEASRGKEAIKAYYRKMVGASPDTILSKYTTNAKLAAPARFFGDIAVADGTTQDEFFPHRRGPFRLDSNWSVTCAKRDGKWQVVHLHLSTNVFDNNLLDEVTKTAWYAGIGGAIAGFALMFAIGWFMRR